MNRTLLTIALLSVLHQMFSISVFAGENNKAQIAFFGTFHFANPGLDKVKSKQMDVSTSANQAYIEKLTHRIGSEFRPTAVLLECARSEQALMDSRYNEYLKSTFKLPINESYQIGFRVAKTAGLEGVHCYDEREIQWQAEPLFKAVPEKAPMLQKRIETTIQHIEIETSRMHREMSLKDILATHNQEKHDIINKSLYLMTNSFGAGEGFEGADAAASWWHRNFRMYANVQSLAPESSRVLVIAGQGHTAIMRDLLAADTDREAVDIKQYFE